MDERWGRVGAFLSSAGCDAVLISSRADIRWLEGFTGSDCWLLASGGESWIIADSRNTELAASECRRAGILELSIPSTTAGDVAAARSLKSGWRRVAFDGSSISYDDHASFAASFAAAGIEFVPAPSRISDLRMIKDDEEISLTRRACAIADGALSKVVPAICEGVSELDIKVRLEHQMKLDGADDISFDTIVLFGARSSQPHATSRRDVLLSRGDFILIDYGAEVGGYRSDTTRTFVFGEASDKQRRAYAAVSKAQVAAISIAGPGASCGELCREAERIIAAEGPKPFEHSLGHGVGLEIHEGPSLRRNSEAKLEPGMIITIEPGTYEPGWGGIRIEDTLLVTSNGVEVLTHYSKKFTEIF